MGIEKYLPPKPDDRVMTSVDVYKTKYALLKKKLKSNGLTFSEFVDAAMDEYLAAKKKVGQDGK